MCNLMHLFGLQLYSLEMNVRFGMRILPLCIVSGFLFSLRAHADDVAGKVTSIVDGNTIEVVSKNNQIHRVLLSGIDSPELDQEYGEQAKKFLEKILLKKDVIVQFKGKDRFGNYLAVVMINGRVDARVKILKEGLAWTSENNPPEDLESYKTWAQRKGKGLWKQKNPVSPWTYRRQQSMAQAKSN